MREMTEQEKKVYNELTANAIQLSLFEDNAPNETSNTFGYARISRKSQNIERQLKNIRNYCQEAIIFQEAYTGTKFYGRTKFNLMIARAKKGDTIVFDSVSRMSRNAEEGIEQYFDLFNKGINLVFLKEPMINTSVYSEAIKQTIDYTGNEIADIYIEATNKVIKIIAQEQIKKAFEQSEKEVTDLHKRTSEGVRNAIANGKRVGPAPGSTLNIKNKEPRKNEIKKYSKDFDGSLTDKDTMRLMKISRNTYYKYKKEIFEELAK